MLRKIIIIAIAFIIILSGFIVYLNKVVLPVKLKAILIKNIETSLNRKTEIELLQFNIFKGIEIKGLTIYENPNFKEGAFVKIKELDLSFLIFPFFKENKVIIPSIKISEPEINLVRGKDNLWNFSDLLNLKFNQDKSKKKFSIFIYKISLLQAKCLFKDTAVEPNFTKEIRDFNCRISFGLPSKLKFIFEGRIPEKNFSSLLSGKGEFDFAKLRAAGASSIKNIDASNYSIYYKDLPFVLNSGKIDNASLNLLWQDKKFDLSINLVTSNLDIIRDSYELKGAPFVNAKISYRPEAQKKLDYSAKINSNGLNLSGILYLNSIEKVNGEILVNPDKIQFSNIQANSAGIAFKLAGILENFANPLINLKLTSEAEVSRLKEIFKQQLKDVAVDIGGKTHLELQVSGLLNEISKLSLSGKATFSNLAAKLPALPKQIKNISGELNFDLNAINWTTLKAKYLGEEYTSSGFLKNFNYPYVEADLKSKLIQLFTKFNLNKNIVTLETVEGKFRDSDFKLNGDIDTSEKDNFLCNLWLKLNTDLKTIKDALPQLKDTLEQIKPEGMVKINAKFNGKIKDKSTWQGNLDAESQEVSFMGLKLNNLALKFLQQESLNDNINIAADCYAGKLGISGKINPTENQIPFNLKVQIDNLDLAKLKLDTPFKDKATSGILNALIALSGLAEDKASWQGRCSLSFKDGSLWELNLFKGLGKFLLIPEFEKIQINEANAELAIANENINVDELELKSNEVIINAEGDVDFMGKLNLKLLTQFSEQFIQNSASLKKFFSNILTTASQILTIKVTGTIQNPKYHPEPAIKDILRALPEAILDKFLKKMP